MLENNWRLIDTGPLSAPENMAIDEALLSCFKPETSHPILRLYGWIPPALSLGRFQDATAVLDLNRCRSDSVPVVRRITGGGVIYHSEELTYSIVCAPHHLPGSSTVKESFRILTGFLVTFYRALGIPAGYAVDVLPVKRRLGERTPFCFAGRESFDILVHGRKIGGNAQRRLKNVIFQHGSIPLLDRVAVGLEYLRDKPPIGDLDVASLGDFGLALDTDDLKYRLAGAFAETLEMGLAPSVLTHDESEMAAALEGIKYRAAAWNLRGGSE